MEGLQSIESAERYVRLLVGWYRFKRFTDSCRGNGKSPIERAGIDLQGRDWLSFLLQDKKVRSPRSANSRRGSPARRPYRRRHNR
jgi:hypothetical protein